MRTEWCLMYLISLTFFLETLCLPLFNTLYSYRPPERIYDASFNMIFNDAGYSGGYRVGRMKKGERPKKKNLKILLVYKAASVGEIVTSCGLLIGVDQNPIIMMFKLFVFLASLVTALCAPSPLPKPLTYISPDITYFKAYSTPLAYSSSYTYNNLGYAPGYYSNYFYSSPLAYTI
ncbi:hypothetical protein GWI33_023013 [Rhynchophorus ferrugineus]|uniref:Uncharacterized protein n=1 Tax=Rhynchophorus ferrugineus TaxID=354439 RepID=A0A834IMF9_RHYFE|nr:hypothetical protein GWI33_023013 [Rhynchophorus ferrugineus]